MAGTFTPGTGADFHYRGTTDGGAPAAGQFALGDWVETPTGIALCQVGGSPGTWADFAFTPTGATVPAIGGGREGLVALGNMGASKTVDISTGNYAWGTLNAASCAIAMPTVANDGEYSFVLELVQDATGGRLATWEGKVLWPGTTVPTLTVTRGKSDVFTFVTRNGGTTWRGFVSGQNFSADASAFNPLSIPWHSAFWASGAEFAALGLADLAQVATWPDEASTHDAVQATGSKQPIFHTTMAALGNRPGLAFDGTDDFLAQAAFTALAQPNELFIVGRLRANTNKFFLDGIAAGNRHILQDTFVPSAQWVISDGGSDVKGGTFDTNAHALRVVFDATDQIFVDGVSAASGDGGSNTLTGLTIGAAYNGTSAGAVDVAFIGLSDTALTTQQRSDLLAWAQAFYGTP